VYLSQKFYDLAILIKN